MTPFRKKLIIHSAIFFVLMVAFGVSLFFIGGRVGAQAIKIESIRSQLYDWVVSLQSFAAIKSEYSTKAERYTQILNNRLPEKELLIDLKKDVQFLAGSEGLTSNLIFNQDSDTKSPQIGAVSITLTLSGDYDAVARFMGRLNEIRYLISIESMTLNKRGDSSNVDIEMKGKVLYKKPNKQIETGL